MMDGLDNLMVIMLSIIDAKLDRGLEELNDIKVRLTLVEEHLAGVHQIERRLDLSEATH